LTIAALAIASAAPAFAQQTKTQQACINAINKDAALTGKTQGKENIACVKDGTEEPVASNCPTADFKNKVAKRIAKTLADDMARCSEMPNFAYTGVAAAGAYRQAELDLLEDVFGSTDLSGTISTDKTIGRCQYSVIKNVEKVSAAASQAFVLCKKSALKGESVALADVQACVGSDGKGKVAGAAAKLGADITERCGSVTISTAFPGVCSTSGDLGACLTALAKCHMCRAANNADALNAPCDTIDDGMGTGSCP
jgi:hypothetical protein